MLSGKKGYTLYRVFQNLHPALSPFRYVINNQGCKSNGPSWRLVTVVTSNARDLALRRAHRLSFPSHILKKAGIRRVFLLARDDSDGHNDGRLLQARIEAENFKYRDLVQGNFQESYKRLAYKHVMGLEWAAKNCNSAR